MPSEQQYREAAERCRGLARQYHDQAAWTPTAPATRFTTAPTVVEIVDDRFAAVVDELRGAADALLQLASICEWRADVCRSYRWALWGYHHAAAEDRQHLLVPQRPYRWVDA